MSSPILNYKSPFIMEVQHCTTALKGMGYLQRFIFFILVALPFMSVSPAHSSLANGNVNILPPTNTSDKVTLALYYETLCPYCADFITNDLVKVFLNDLYTIVNLKLVPWGNADILGDEPHCQVRIPFFI